MCVSPAARALSTEGSRTAGPTALEDEFGEVFQRERRRLFGIAFSILRDPLEAEDAVQEIASQAWRAWITRSDPTSTPAWLTTICVRQSLRQRKRLRRYVFTSGDEHLRLHAATEHLRYEGHHIDLDRAYTSLSRQQRAIVTLHYQHGYAISECATLMGCSAGAASSHLSRALAKLRKGLGYD